MMRLLLLPLLLSLGGCTTQFTGGARVGTVRECQTKCASSDQQLVAFAYLGDYSTTCSCGERVTNSVAHVAAVQQAAIGVILQMRAEQQTNSGAMH